MGDISLPAPVLPILAAFSRHEPALAWAREQAEAAWGPVALAGDVLVFDQTDYYQETMGTGLKKVLLAFAQRMDPARLVDRKHQTNAWEEAYRRSNSHPEPRPLNLDPGYLTAAKLVLATTKDRDHRIYLDRGIFAEVTLHFRRGQGWCGHPWTYPDYRSEPYGLFFTRCRHYLRGLAHES
jgi:hypothetical protein